jgi:hypothetical protein
MFRVKMFRGSKEGGRGHHSLAKKGQKARRAIVASKFVLIVGTTGLYCDEQKPPLVMVKGYCYLNKVVDGKNWDFTNATTSKTT